MLALGSLEVLGPRAARLPDPGLLRALPALVSFAISQGSAGDAAVLAGRPGCPTEVTDDLHDSRHRDDKHSVSPCCTRGGCPPATDEDTRPRPRRADALVDGHFGAAGDTGMPFLPAALDPGTARQELNRHLPTMAQEDAPLRLAKIRVERHKPGRRCLMKYELRAERGGAVIVLCMARA